MELIRPELYKLIGLLEVRSRKWMHGNRLSGNQFRGRGRGMEFKDVREYLTGDDIRHIDWNVTSRTGELHVKEFFQERDLPVVVFLDVSPSMHSSLEKLDAAFQLVALLLSVHGKSGNPITLVAYDEKVVFRSATIRSREEIWRNLKRLNQVIQDLKIGEGGTDHSLPLRVLQNEISIRSLVYLVSDFANLPETLQWRILMNRHDITPFFLAESLSGMDWQGLDRFFYMAPTESKSLASNYISTETKDYELLKNYFSGRLKTIQVDKNWMNDLIAILQGGI